MFADNPRPEAKTMTHVFRRFLRGISTSPVAAKFQSHSSFLVKITQQIAPVCSIKGTAQSEAEASDQS